MPLEDISPPFRHTLRCSCEIFSMDASHMFNSYIYIIFFTQQTFISRLFASHEYEVFSSTRCHGECNTTQAQIPEALLAPRWQYYKTTVTLPSTGGQQCPGRLPTAAGRPRRRIQHESRDCCGPDTSDGASEERKKKRLSDSLGSI